MRDEFTGNPWNDFATTRECLYTVFASRPGFHGDLQLINFVESILEKSKLFIETGSYHGCTSYYVSKNFPNVDCYSSEIDPTNYTIALNNCESCQNLRITQTKSPGFLKVLLEQNTDMINQPTVFWLDAHDSHRNSGPIQEEIRFITENFKSYYIFVDDVDTENTPQLEQFDLKYILEVVDLKKNKIFIPKYTEKTGYALTGWTLITNMELETASNDISTLKL